MNLSSLLIGLVLITSAVLGVYTLVDDLATTENYNVAVNDTYKNAFNKTTAINNELAGKYSEVQNLSANSGSAFQIITLVPDVLSIIKSVISMPFTVAGEIIESMVDFLSLPEWVATTLLSVLTIILIFSFISLVLRYKS